MSALLVSSYVLGTLSDKIGRKKTSFISILMVAVGILISSFMPEYISFTVVRFFTGFGAYTNTIFYASL
jgi:OCT family organic cation transporter-like MFS transporter 4/5